jgi:hypothetical protein
MFEICRHIKSNGLRCKAAAVRGSAYCHFHIRVRRTCKTSTGLWDDVRLPVLEDPADVQFAISEVVNALLSSRVDGRRAGLLLYALQIASQNLSRITQPTGSEAAQETTSSASGEEIAPVKTVCEPADCPSCPQRLTCNGENLAQPPQPALSPKANVPVT